MKKSILMVLCLCVAFGILACRSKTKPPSHAPAPISPSPVVAPPAYTAEEGAIVLKINADPQLNSRQGSPRAVLVCVHQLRGSESYERLTQDEAGLKALLACDAFDPSVAEARQFAVQPDQEVEYRLNRVEGARVVGVVVGYSPLARGSSVRLFEVPVLQIRTGDPNTPLLLKPDRLRIELNLGPVGLQ